MYALIDVNHGYVKAQTFLDVLSPPHQNTLEPLCLQVGGSMCREAHISEQLPVFVGGIKDSEDIDICGIEIAGHEASEFISLGVAIAVGLDEVLGGSTDSDRARRSDSLLRNLLHSDIDTCSDRIAPHLTVSWVLNHELKEECVDLLWEGDASWHVDHARVAVELETVFDGRPLELECLVRKIPVIFVFDVDTTNVSVGRAAPVVVDKNIAVSRLHWIVIDVANDQGQSAHSAEVLVVAYPDRNVVFLLLFPENLKCIFST